MINKLFRILKMAFFAPVGLLVGIDPITAGAIAFGVGGGLNLFGSSKAAKKAKAAAEAAARERARLLEGYTPMQITQAGVTPEGQLDTTGIGANQLISPTSVKRPTLQLAETPYQQPEQAKKSLQLVRGITEQRAVSGTPEAERNMLLQQAREEATKARTEATAENLAQQRAMGLTGGIASRRQQEMVEAPINEQFANFAFNLGLRSMDEAKEAQRMLIDLAQIETEEERYRYQSDMSRTLFNNQVREQMFQLDQSMISYFNQLNMFNKNIELNKIKLQINSSDSYYSDIAAANQAKYQAISGLGSSIAQLGMLSMFSGGTGKTSTTNKPILI